MKLARGHALAFSHISADGLLFDMRIPKDARQKLEGTLFQHLYYSTPIHIT